MGRAIAAATAGLFALRLYYVYGRRMKSFDEPAAFAVA